MLSGFSFDTVSLYVTYSSKLFNVTEVRNKHADVLNLPWLIS